MNTRVAKQINSLFLCACGAATAGALLSLAPPRFPSEAEREAPTVRGISYLTELGNLLEVTGGGEG